MSPHRVRWLPVAIFLAVTAISSAAGANIIHEMGMITCPGVDGTGMLVLGGSSRPFLTISLNEKTRAYHGTVKTTVTNLLGRNVTVFNSGFGFGIPGITKSKYTVKANGDATFTVHGVLPP
jgi:hypothetical protein